MMNAINNNQTQAMDYFFGMYDKENLVEILNTARQHRIKYRRVGDNYLFYWDYVTTTANDELNAKELSKYKYFMAIEETVYDIAKSADVKEISLFATNDDKKAEKFTAFFKANKLNDKNNLGLSTQELEGKIFASRRERREMSENGMYLG